MILFLVLTIGIFQFCGGSLSDLELNVIITKINVDFFNEGKADFKEITIIDREYFCEKLGKTRLYPFEPLPLPHEYFTISVDNASLPNALTFQDIPSSSSSEPIQNSSQFLNIGNSSLHQDRSSLGTLEDFINLFRSVMEITRKVVDTITIGSKQRKVSALPCTFNNYTIYVVPVVEFDGALLFLHNGSSSPMSLGIIIPLLRFSEINNASATQVFYNLFLNHKINYKKNRIISPLPKDKKETPDPLNIVKNLTLCTSLFHKLCIKFGNKKKLKISSMEYVELEIFNALRCYHTGNFGPYVYQLSEIPRGPLTLLMLPHKPENSIPAMLYEVFPQYAMTKKSFYFKSV